MGNILVYNQALQNFIEKSHYLEKIEEYASQLFCMGKIGNVKEAMKIYEDFGKKIPLDWPLCVSEIMTIISKLKININKLKKNILINNSHT